MGRIDRRMPAADPFALFAARGHTAYVGEPVSQVEHACQAAALARAAGAPSHLVVAALLHDVGHLLVDDEEATRRGDDTRHERMGARYLARWFGPTVTEPVRLHVAAKRYLARDPHYAARLSEESRRSLQLQGGVMDAAEAAAFAAETYFEAAIHLRQWDDLAKEVGWRGADFDTFHPMIEEARAFR